MLPVIFNRPFPSCPLPQFQNKSRCETIEMKMTLICMKIDMKVRASDRVRKKITNYAEIFRTIMRKKVLIMRKTRWIMRKIFGSLRSPKITSFHAAEIELPPKPRVCSQAHFKQKKLYWSLGFSSYFHLYLVCYEIILSIIM